MLRIHPTVMQISSQMPGLVPTGASNLSPPTRPSSPLLIAQLEPDSGIFARSAILL